MCIVNLFDSYVRDEMPETYGKVVKLNRNDEIDQLKKKRLKSVHQSNDK